MRSINYNPIVLFKEPSIGQTIIEKIESNVENICFAVVIYTSCDLGKAKESPVLTPRARQNVVFEKFGVKLEPEVRLIGDFK